MKKKLLFIMSNLQNGGAERSLVNLLQLMDYDKYEVDLLLFQEKGMFLGQVDKRVNILHDGYDKLQHTRSFVKAAPQNISSIGGINFIVEFFLYVQRNMMWLSPIYRENSTIIWLIRLEQRKRLGGFIMNTPKQACQRLTICHI